MEQAQIDALERYNSIKTDGATYTYQIYYNSKLMVIFERQEWEAPLIAFFHGFGIPGVSDQNTLNNALKGGFTFLVTNEITKKEYWARRYT